jgi:hypothetical protein
MIISLKQLKQKRAEFVAQVEKALNSNPSTTKTFVLKI